MSADGHIEIEVELNSEKAEKELDSLSKNLEKDTAQAAKKAETSVKQSVKQVEVSAKQASKQTESSAKKAGNAVKQAGKSAETSVKSTGKQVESTAKQTGNSIASSAKSAEKQVETASKQTSEQVKKNNKEIGESSKTASEQSAQYWTGAGSKIKSILSTITAATATGVAAGTAAINAGRSFEAGMSEVKAISGASRKDLEALTNKAKEMGATTKFSATQASEGLKYMAMAGWNSQQMIAGLPGVMNLAAASGENLGTVSDIVTEDRKSVV